LQRPPTLTDVAHYVEIPELGREVAATGRIGPAKTREVIAALTSVIERARAHGYSELVAGATAAVRLASDRDEFLAAASAAIGTPVRLIGEAREAELSFDGVASRHASRRTWLMADVGGGSTELVVGSGSRLERWASLPLGSGSLAARHLSDPPRRGEREALRAAAVAEVGAAPECDTNRLVVTGGTAANLAFVLSRLRPPTVLTVAALLAAAERLDSAPAIDVAARVGLPEPVVRALRGGVELLLLLLDFYGMGQFHVSHAGLRHGMLLARLESDRWW
jgi:exopolyphosphatase/guanosine-5'-triphosphate,3'-diphosphate pyrophosphatase